MIAYLISASMKTWGIQPSLNTSYSFKKGLPSLPFRIKELIENESAKVLVQPHNSF